MPITKLAIDQFRNINSLILKPNPNINLIIGENASGKSSLLESIYFLGLGRSFRTHLISRVIQFESSKFTIFAEITDKGITTPIGLQKNKNGISKLRIDNQNINKLSILTKHLPIQLLTPDSHTLLSGSPKDRRAYIDWGVFYYDSSFSAKWSRIQRLIKQRNALLKQCKTYKELEMWDNELCLLSNELSEQRANYFDLLKPYFNEIITDCLPEFTITSSFFCGWDNANKSLKNILENNFNRDKQFGFTTAGSQKADIRFKIDGIPAIDILSKGQLKILVYALRLAQGVFLNIYNKKKCVFLIDDFCSELDTNRQKILAKHIYNLNAQVFITAIELNSVDKIFGTDNTVFHVKHGKITAE